MEVCAAAPCSHTNLVISIFLGGGGGGGGGVKLINEHSNFQSKRNGA